MPDSELETQNPVTAQPTGASHLRQELANWQARFDAQPPMVQRFLEAQGQQLAEKLIRADGPTQIRFTLPDRVRPEPAEAEQAVPPELREHLAGGLMERLARATLGRVLRQRLAELEQSPHRAVAAAAGLLRHATAVQLVTRLLPAGRTVRYDAAPGDEIPSLPVSGALEPESAITAAEARSSLLRPRDPRTAWPSHASD